MKDYILQNSKNINNLYDSYKKENNHFFYSEGNQKSKKYIVKNFDKNPISNFLLLKNIKSNKSIFFRVKSKNINKNYSKEFSKNLHRKVKSLNNITKTCNTELIRLIDINNKVDENSVKHKLEEKKEEIEKELDIRKALLDENLQDKKMVKYKALMDDVRIEINLSNSYNKHTMNFIKKKINIISDTIALDLLEKCLGIKKKVGFDINQLFNEHINKKKELQSSKFKEIKKKAEKNYQKMVKLRHNLSFHSPIKNND